MLCGNFLQAGADPMAGEHMSAEGDPPKEHEQCSAGEVHQVCYLLARVSGLMIMAME